MKRCILTICLAFGASLLIALGFDYLFPDKDMFYWQVGLSCLAGVGLQRVLLREK
ncbi:hypothetical protein [Conchiformibius kuhniae]|uniref:Uncharacterized protein n=1 Tax=Conchiformibius kuhniae TaxID=211502 RepID=A0A8T9MUP8_9NEIS|nr:hypothetical protein [Conchiformibius kuhniae]UOP04575.1 hypothetical protein LVJ77_10030 [Conchiformibius kuhniae]